MSADKILHAFQEHVRVAVKEKLRSVGMGGMEKVFKKVFSVGEVERLIKDSCCECYLSTTAGPIAGLLFISTQKLAFCSHTSISFCSPKGDSLTLQYYKVLIPLRKIKRVNVSKNVEKPSHKYIEIVTVDDFDFWFMGFLDYQKAFKRLHHAISQLS
ncbi:GEM-like protein 4 [Carica papaya]|uniref:GEM-like protein 4 n=1 Tax=Carica papaya TaxID=3649 RepID=UPI000B8CF6AB|nr:GEM-like protein 4 [Carica papaya]